MLDPPLSPYQEFLKKFKNWVVQGVFSLTHSHTLRFIDKDTNVQQKIPVLKNNKMKNILLNIVKGILYQIGFWIVKGWIFLVTLCNTYLYMFLLTFHNFGQPI